MDEPAMRAGEIIERTLGLIRDNAVPVAIATVALAASGLAVLGVRLWRRRQTSKK